MSGPPKPPDNPSATNDDWPPGDYEPGIMIEGSLFSPLRDETIWGPQDPLDVIPPGGPFDEPDGDESWRVGTNHVWTGEARVLSRRPTERQQEQRTRFWERYDATRARVEQPRLPTDAGDQEAAHDLPQPSGPAPSRTPGPASEASVIPETAAPTPHTPTPPRPSSPMSIDGDFEVVVDDDYHPATPEQPAAPAEHLPNSPSRMNSSPPGIDDPLATPADPTLSISDQHPSDAPPASTQSNNPSDPHNTSPSTSFVWTDDLLLRFWKWKTIRKKGYAPMLEHFPGQTVESLSRAWRENKERCEVLGQAWKEAGRPGGTRGTWGKDSGSGSGSGEEGGSE